MDARKILKRTPEAPILHPKDFPGINTLFNPTPAEFNGKILLLVSATTNVNCRGNSYRETFLATSDDGIDFILDCSKPFIDQKMIPEPYRSMGGIIDSRLTKIGDIYYGIAPMGTWEIGHAGVASVMYSTKDFQNVEFLGITTLPYSRGCSLFPEKINGLYRRLERPGHGSEPCGIWISESPDLVHWGNYKPLLAPGWSPWNHAKIGPTPPKRTEKGWLVVIHGVESTLGVSHYYIGALLLDIANPEKIIGKTHSYLLAPEMPYEINGAVSNVVFPCGFLIDEEKDELILYYGAADTCVCRASGKLSDVLNACENNW